MSTRKRLIAPQNRNYRQSEDAKITGYSNGRWELQVEGRDHAYTDIGGTWLDADNPVGDLARIAFVQANPLLPVFFSRGSRPNAAFVTAVPVSPVATADWRCEHGDFARRNSATSQTFDFAAAGPVSSLASLAGVATGLLPRFYDGHAAWISPDYVVINPEDEGYDEEIGGGSPYQLGPYLFQRLPEDSFVWAHNLADQLTVPDWSTWSADTLCILDDGEIALGWFEQHEEESILLPRDYLTIFANDGISGARKTVSFSIRRRDGADTVQVGDYLCTPLLSTGDGSEAIHCWQISGTTTTATELDLEGATSSGLVGAVWPNPESNLPESWVGASRFIVQDGSGGLYGIDPSVPAIDWTYSGTKALRGIAVNGATLICAYETSTYDTVTDVFASTEWVDGGGSSEDRDILAEGKSILGGLVYISCSSGSELSTHEFPGEVDAGFSLGPILETRTEHDGQSYTSPTFPTSLGDGYWFSGWGSPFIRMRNAIIPGEDPPDAPGESETYPYATATWANDLWESISHYGLPPVSGTGPGDAWLAEASARFNEEREALVAQAFEIMGARPGPEYYLKRELWRNTWSSYSATSQAYDNLHTRIGGTIYTEPPSGSGNPLPEAVNRAVPSNYEGTEEAGSIADTEAPLQSGPYPDGSYWITEDSVKTYSWELVKVWRNVQEELPRTQTAPPEHALGPVAIGLGLIVHSPSASLGVGVDATWVARLISSPATPAWTYTVPSTGPEIQIGNTWIDSDRVWIEYDAGAGWKLVGLRPDSGTPAGDDPDISLDTGRTVFDGTNVHDYFTDWAIGP